MQDEASLPSRAAHGDRVAFAALMDATKADLHRFVRRYVGEDDDAYDLVQETYVAAWLAIRRYDPARPQSRHLLMAMALSQTGKGRDGS